MKIRYAEKRDMEYILELCHEHALFEKNYFDKSKKELLLKHIFNSYSPLQCMMIESDTEIVGYTTFFKQFSTWDSEYYLYLDCLFLKENARGKGTGKQIMNRIKEYAKNINCSMIQWQTPDFNTGAISFYEKLGAERKSKERFTWKI